MKNGIDTCAPEGRCKFSFTDPTDCKIIHRDVEETRAALKDLQNLVHKLDKTLVKIVVISSLTSTFVSSLILGISSRVVAGIV